MIKQLLIVILIITQAQFCWAECSKPVTFLRQGETALCDSFAFTRDAESQNYHDLQMGSFYKELSDLQAKKINLMAQDSDLDRARISELDKALRSANTTNDLNKVIYFTGGALITYLIFKVVEANVKK